MTHDVRIRGSLERWADQPAMSLEELRALAARALQMGVVVFLRDDLDRMPAMARALIEGEAKRLYGDNSRAGR